MSSDKDSKGKGGGAVSPKLHFRGLPAYQISIAGMPAGEAFFSPEMFHHGVSEVVGSLAFPRGLPHS